MVSYPFLFVPSLEGGRSAHTHTHARTHACTHARTHTHTDTHTHTHTHTYTHTSSKIRSRGRAVMALSNSQRFLVTGLGRVDALSAPFPPLFRSVMCRTRSQLFASPPPPLSYLGALQSLRRDTAAFKFLHSRFQVFTSNKHT